MSMQDVINDIDSLTVEVSRDVVAYLSAEPVGSKQATFLEYFNNLDGDPANDVIEYLVSCVDRLDYGNIENVEETDPKDDIIRGLIRQLSAQNQEIKALIQKVEDRNAGTIENGLRIESVADKVDAQIKGVMVAVSNIPAPVDNTQDFKEMTGGAIRAISAISTDNQAVLADMSQKLGQKPLRFDVSRNKDGNITSIIPVYSRPSNG